MPCRANGFALPDAVLQRPCACSELAGSDGAAGELRLRMAPTLTPRSKDRFSGTPAGAEPLLSRRSSSPLNARPEPRQHRDFESVLRPCAWPVGDLIWIEPAMRRKSRDASLPIQLKPARRAIAARRSVDQ